MKCNLCNFLQIQGKGLEMQKLVALNERGRVIGENHPRARLLDSEVDQVLELVESGMSYARIAEKMQITKSCVGHIASGRRRCQTPVRYATVSVEG